MAKNEQLDKIVYWDACVFLHFLNGVTSASVQPNEAERNKIARWVFAASETYDQAEKRKLEIWTSEVSVAEVAFTKIEQSAKTLTTPELKRIERLWLTSSPIIRVEVFSGIVRAAQEAIRRSFTTKSGNRKTLKPMDAIHIASALHVAKRTGKSVEIHSTDLPMLSHHGVYQVPITEPRDVLAIGAPSLFAPP